MTVEYTTKTSPLTNQFGEHQMAIVSIVSDARQFLTGAGSGPRPQSNLGHITAGYHGNNLGRILILNDDKK